MDTTQAQWALSRRRAVRRFLAAVEEAKAASKAVNSPREAVVDAATHVSSLIRQEQAVLTQSERHVPPSSGAPRVVLAHRSLWMLSKLEAALARRGAVVVAVVDDGADATGVTVAEQPDLLIAENRLATVTALQLVTLLREHSSGTQLVIYGGFGPELNVLRSHGAGLAFDRLVSPDDVVEESLESLRGSAGQRAYA
jgi:uncharacterized protein GlcG (DUF336 family)